MEQITIKGFIKNIEDHVLDVHGLKVGDEFLSERFEDFVHKQVSVRFYLCNEEKSKNELRENLILATSGVVDAEYSPVYSEITGYLWTDEDLKIGNHDIISFLKDYDGKYLYLEVDILE